MPTKLFDVPNLDDLSVEKADFEQAAEVLQTLAAYCHRKAIEIQDRLDGDMEHAAGSRRILERIYQQLPEWARW